MVTMAPPVIYIKLRCGGKLKNGKLCDRWLATVTDKAPDGQAIVIKCKCGEVARFK